MTQAKLIVTADDLGLDESINAGIFKAHRLGLVTSAALLANGPATTHAIELCKQHPDLEVGIHLSIVEGLSLTGIPSSVTDRNGYFDEKLCLHRHWRPFLSRYVLGQINLRELEAELDLQILAFRRHFTVIPFANSTQHLHLLPKVGEVVLRLARKHGIKRLRAPSPFNIKRVKPNIRSLQGAFLSILGDSFRSKCTNDGVAIPDFFFGFESCGRLTIKDIEKIANDLKFGISEIMTHPGEDSPKLRKDLPWGYSTFNWSGEMNALMSQESKDALYRSGVALARFRDLG